MSPNAVFYSLLLIGLAACPSITMAFNHDIVDRICLPDAAVMPPFGKRIRVPVGCELIDCCPGCPGPGSIEWRIRIDGKVLEGAELRFEGLSVGGLKRLKIRGNAKLDGDRILLRRGSSTIGGVPETADGKITVGSLAPIVAKNATTRRLSRPAGSKARRGNLAAGRATDAITVRQFLGSFLVNSLEWRSIFMPCVAPPGAQGDTLKITDIVGGGNVAVMLDARTQPGVAGCSNDDVKLSTGDTLALDNLRAPAGCNSEIAIFSANNAMYFESPVTPAWTDSPGDLHTVGLKPLIDVPVSVWITYSAAEARAQDEINNANLLYIQNKVGIQFNPTYYKVWEWNDQSAIDTIVSGVSAPTPNNISCTNTILQFPGLQFQGKRIYTPNTLNVYYVQGAPADFTGRNCALLKTPPWNDCKCTMADQGDSNVTYIGSKSNLASLAHELGHAFGLRPAANCGGHTNDPSVAANFGTDNIMDGGGSNLRNYFSLGQVFRMNTHMNTDPSDMCGGTMLIKNNQRPGPGRECPPLANSKMCPALDTK